jgi:hypothetical protein
MVHVRRKPTPAEAYPWPADDEYGGPRADVRPFTADWRRPVDFHGLCGRAWGEHGLLTLDKDKGSKVVCPGDWLVTTVPDGWTPMKPGIFERLYEAIPGDLEPIMPALVGPDAPLAIEAGRPGEGDFPEQVEQEETPDDAPEDEPEVETVEPSPDDVLDAQPTEEDESTRVLPFRGLSEEALSILMGPFPNHRKRDPQTVT